MRAPSCSRLRDPPHQNVREGPEANYHRGQDADVLPHVHIREPESGRLSTHEGSKAEQNTERRVPRRRGMQKRVSGGRNGQEGERGGTKEGRQ